MHNHTRRLLPPTMLATAAVTAFALTSAAAQVKGDTFA